MENTRAPELENHPRFDLLEVSAHGRELAALGPIHVSEVAYGAVEAVDSPGGR